MLDVTHLIGFLVLAAPHLCRGEVCGAGWIEGLHDTCFKIVSTRSTWDTAMGTCKDLGGSLATLDTPARNAFIIGNLAMITETLKHDCWWIGARRIDGKVQWIDQESFPFDMTYTFWKKGQPDNSGGIEDRIHICKYDNGAGQAYRWNDEDSDRTDPFICEKKANVENVFGK